MKRRFSNIIEGEIAYLEQVSPKFFPDIVKWRNTERIKRFINQPQLLTLEMQRYWYEHIYAEKDDECLYIMVDKATKQPFGTMGMNDLNLVERSFVSGHYLVGEDKYLQSVAVLETGRTFTEYCLNELGCEKIYCHIVKDNKKVINMHMKSGFKENSMPRYPQYTKVGDKILQEFVFDKNDDQCMAIRTKYNKKINKILQVLK